MATEKQIAANRANAKKSTGPKSVTGKERSSRNSIKHGLSRLATRSSPAATSNAIVAALGVEEITEKQLIAAVDFASAQSELLQIQAVRAAQWSRIGLSVESDGDFKELKQLASLDRYERYARTKRRKAVKKLRAEG
jgi:hypothetical protein